MSAIRTAICLLLLLAGLGLTPAHAQSYDYQVHWDLIYTPADWPQALRGDLYLPQGEGAWPVVLLVHGGSWQRGRRGDMAPIARQLAQAGYAAFTVSYRLAPAARFPAQLEDLQAALRWLEAHSGAYRLDTQRLGAWGFSAGAHLAALLGGLSPDAALHAPGTPRLRAVVAGGTPADLRRYPRSPAVRALLGVALAENPALYAQASPVTQVGPQSPAFFLYHGRRDALVEPAQPELLAAALREAGVAVELRWLERWGHMGSALFPGPVMAPALAFLAQRLGGNGRLAGQAPAGAQ